MGAGKAALKAHPSAKSRRTKVPPKPSSKKNHAKLEAKKNPRKYYPGFLQKVIDESDIILLVLDARDPEGCRSRSLEEEVRKREAEGKRLAFVLNKVDLVPRANAQAWLTHFRYSTPTLPFLSPSASQHQTTDISSPTAPALRKFLKAYKPKVGNATIGVVGYPNVGKSSLINSLKRMKICEVAAQPGHTKELQSVQLERGLRIIDSPGVVFGTGGKGNKKNNWRDQNMPPHSRPPTTLITPIAPDAKNAGTRIVLNIKPSRLEDLFKASDVGAFGNENGEIPMVASDNGHVSFDAEEDTMTGAKMDFEGQPPHKTREVAIESNARSDYECTVIKRFLSIIRRLPLIFSRKRRKGTN